MQTTASYLRPGRLADVLALIQVLAYDRSTSRSEDGLRDELQRMPGTGESWIALAREHPEFFRVRSEEAKTPRAALVARYVADYQPLPGGGEKRPPLAPQVVNTLLDFAVKLHDKQLERKLRWRTFALPIVAMVITAAVSVTSAFIAASAKSSPCATPAPRAASLEVLRLP